MSMQPLPVHYTLEIAKQRMADLERSSTLNARSKQGLRRALASRLRKLADRIEPALAMGIPVQRRAA
jgi:hypothetical protein